MPSPSFQQLRVLSLESRRASEIASLITTYGGRPLSAPALREIPLESNADAIAFGRSLAAGGFDLVVFLTGVGLRALLAVMDSVGERAPFLDALGRTRLAVRGPKPLAVLRELKLTPWVTAPEPNTWKELLAALDAAGDVRGLRVALQEYGTSNPDLLAGLAARGAAVTRVPVYQYGLPEDVEPLRRAVTATLDGDVDLILFTTATQAVHFLQVADDMGVAPQLRERMLRRTVIASIGPTTSEELKTQGLAVNLEASHPKMGFLVREAAERGAELVTAKRA